MANASSVPMAGILGSSFDIDGLVANVGRSSAAEFNVRVWWPASIFTDIDTYDWYRVIIKVEIYLKN